MIWLMLILGHIIDGILREHNLKELAECHSLDKDGDLHNFIEY